jgi:chemotaxis signal transduction protein
MSSKWVTFCLGTEVYGVEITHVREMVALMSTRTVPRQPQEQLGVAILRNEILPVMDLRKILGVSNVHASKDIVDTLEARKQDHVNWLNALEQCIDQDCEFKLALDPTQCKFGKWYAEFKTDDPKLKVILQQAAIPHAKIHELGKTAINLGKEGRKREAQVLIAEHKNTTLAKLITLLNEAMQQVLDSTRQVVVVLQGDGGLVGISVDSLHSVVQIDDNEIQHPDSVGGLKHYEAISGYWPHAQSGVVTRLLDVSKMYPALSAAEME